MSVSKSEIISTLNGVSHELRGLRHENAILRAKAEVLDVFAAALGVKDPRGPMGMCVDPVWHIEQLKDRLAAESVDERGTPDQSTRYSGTGQSATGSESSIDKVRPSSDPAFSKDDAATVASEAAS